MNAEGHLTQAEVEAFGAADALSPAERLAISDHVAGCPDCRAQLRATAPSRAPEVFAALVEEHRRALAERPATEELLASLSTNPTLADATVRELLETRLSPHPDARAELENLRAFRAGLEKFPAETFAPGSTAPAPAARSAARSQPRSFAWFWLWLPVGAAVAAALVAVLGWWPSRFLVSERPRVAAATQLTDGPVQVSASGEVRSALDLPADLRDAILETVRRRALPGVGFNGAFRGGGATNSPNTTAPVAATGFAPLSPVGSVVESTRPALRWRPHADAARYEVTLNLSGENTDTARRETLPAGATAWTPPESLERGRFYRWQVAALGSDGRELAREPAAPGALFKVLSAPAHEALERLRRDFAGSHLVLGVAYAREGLRDEAAAEFRALRSAHPDSALARELAATESGQP